MTKSARSISIQFWLPILVVCIGSIIWAIMTWQEYTLLKTNLIKSSKQLIQQDMTLLQNELQTEIRKGFYDEAEQAVTIRGVNNHYKNLILVDDRMRVRFSTRFAYKGKAVTEVLPVFDMRQFDQVSSQKHAKVILAEDQCRFFSYFPVILGRRPNEMRSRRVGVIFLEYDISRDMEAIISQLLKNSLLIALILITTLGLLFLFINFFITRPINQLVANTRKIATGHYDAINNINGTGEIVLMFRAINDMSQQLSKREQQLDEAMTELQNKERWQDQLLNTLPNGVQESDIKGLITFSNDAHHRMLGVKNGKLIGQYIWDYQPDEENKAALAEYLEYLVNEQPKPTPYITFNKSADGRDIFLEIIWDYQRNEAGDITGFISVISDITERKQIEEALRRSQKMEAIGQLTGGIAHDFNNILGIITGHLSLLELEHDIGSKAQQRLEIINQTVQRAVDLTRQLLGFSSRQASLTEVIDINHLIKHVEHLLTQSLTPQIEIEYQYAEQLWLTEINTGEFEDALLNLALNARDAMTGQGKLTIETHNTILDVGYCSINPGVVAGEYVQITVSDTGVGIPHEQQERIFEPFFTTKEPGKGTGLGLSMVFGFVKRSDGHIKVYSEQGIGTTFRLYLPRAVGKQQKTDRQEWLAKSVLPKGIGSILVVDDELALLDLVEETLKLQGYNVITAKNATEALEKLKQHPEIDLLFSDVVMPGELNGYELAEKAAKLYPDLKVLLTSGYTETAIAKNGQARFNANLLTKPYTLDELSRQIRTALSSFKKSHK
jgi:PAS domain S-box-containing protein